MTAAEAATRAEIIDRATSFMIHTDRDDIYWDEDECRVHGIGTLIAWTVSRHIDCIISLYHDHEDGDGFDVLWEGTGAEAVAMIGSVY